MKTREQQIQEQILKTLDEPMSLDECLERLLEPVTFEVELPDLSYTRKIQELHKEETEKMEGK